MVERMAPRIAAASEIGRAQLIQPHRPLTVARRQFAIVYPFRRRCTAAAKITCRAAIKTRPGIINTSPILFKTPPVRESFKVLARKDTRPSVSLMMTLPVKPSVTINLGQPLGNVFTFNIANEVQAARLQQRVSRLHALVALLGFFAVGDDRNARLAQAQDALGVDAAHHSELHQILWRGSVFAPRSIKMAGVVLAGKIEARAGRSIPRMRPTPNSAAAITSARIALPT